MQLFATVCALYSIYARTLEQGIPFSNFSVLISEADSFYKANAPWENGKFLSTRKIRQSLLVFYIPCPREGHASFPLSIHRSSVSHLFLLFSFLSFLLLKSHCFLLESSPCSRRLKLSAGQRKALVELFTILPLYCLSRYLAIKSSSILYSRNRDASDVHFTRFVCYSSKVHLYRLFTRNWLLISGHVLVSTLRIDWSISRYRNRSISDRAYCSIARSPWTFHVN